MKNQKQAKRQAKQLFRLCLVNEMLDEDRARQVAQYIAAMDRRKCPAILKHFLRLLSLDRAQHAANVASATLLPADVQAEIQTSLLRRYGLGLNITFAARPDLIGGVRIQVGSDVYDASVLAGLMAVEKSLRYQ